MAIGFYRRPNQPNDVRVHMGACRHGQGGHKYFLCISSYSKTLSRQKFMNYFHSLSVASEGFAPDLHRAPSLDPAGKLSSQDP